MKTQTGRIRQEDLEEVRRRANLVEVASDYMQVKRAGGNRFKALCPFHTEKTPSLSLEPGKGLYHCFGCQEGGDVFSLVMKLESLSFVEAVERLARRVGVDLRYEQLSGADRAALKRRHRLVDAHRAAMERYHEHLKRAPEATDARTYLLQRRDFTKESLEAFGVGFSMPRWDDCVTALGRAGFSEQEILDAGLGVRRDSGGLIDRFRGRIMFPILDVTGDPVAFGARKLRDDEGPKYLNSAESPIYKKGQMLYALSSAKGEIVKGGRAVIVEGYTDVIALHQAGLHDAVATCGTALGLEHLRTLQRFTQQVVLSLDADEAGGAAADRTYEQLIGEAQRMGLSLKVVLLPGGTDPADAVREGGAESFRTLVDGSVPLLEFVLRREAARYAVGDPDEQLRALRSCVRIIAKTETQQLQQEYVRLLSDWIKVDANILFVELANAVRAGGVPQQSSAATTLKRSSAQVRLEKEALKLAIQHPEMTKAWLEDLDPESFTVPAHRAIWTALTATPVDERLADALDERARKAFHPLAVEPAEGDVTDRLVTEVFGRLKEFAVSRQIEDAKARLQKLNPESDREQYDRLFAALVDLERTKRRLSQGELEDH